MSVQRSQSRVVAIVDDNERMRERFADFVRAKGFEPFVFEGRLNSVSSLVSEAKRQGAVYAVCDHRLFERNYATFFGAEAVAGFYDSHLIAPLLVTGYENADSETTIRVHRRKIPSLLHSRDVTPDTIANGLNAARLETIEGLLPPEREPCPAIMSVTDLLPQTRDTLVRVIVAQWRPDAEVGFPLSMIPDAMRCHVRAGSLLRAEINVDAARAEDLYFVNFSLPNADDVKKADINFDRP
jgi:hypothetical protein